MPRSAMTSTDLHAVSLTGLQVLVDCVSIRWMEVVYDPDGSIQWLQGASAWLYVVPWGMQRIVHWIKTRYNNPPMYITENGDSRFLPPFQITLNWSSSFNRRCILSSSFCLQ